jgi:hypothetical protein
LSGLLFDLRKKAMVADGLALMERHAKLGDGGLLQA